MQVKRISAGLLAAILVLVCIQIPAFAAISINQPVVNYTEGSITIRGTLARSESGLRVSYTITDAEGAVVYRNQNFSGAGGAFRDTVLLSKLFSGGTYTLSVHASGYETPVTTTFSIDRAQEVVYADEVSIEGATGGIAEEGTELIGAYTFFSGFGQDEGASRYTWLLGASADGDFPYAIEGADKKSYTFRTADIAEIVRAHETEFAAHQFFIKFAVEAQSFGSDVYAPRVESAAVQVNSIPVASNVSISGNGAVGQTLTGSYIYYDLANRKEAGSAYRWLTSNTQDGVYQPLADGISYIPNTKDVGHYLKFEVTPTAQSRTAGNPAVSSSSIYIGTGTGGGINGGGGFGGGGTGGMGGGISGGGATGSMAVKGENIPDTTVTPNTPDYVPGAFSDVPSDHWARITIRDVVLRGDAQGVDNQHFEPERNITRAEFAKLILNTLDREEQPYSGGLSDVKADDWYAGTVQAVMAEGIMTGYDGRFEPNAPITREEMAKVVVEAYLTAGKTVADAGEAPFSDADSISDWAKSTVAQASGLGFINGLPDGSFAPKAEATRAEAVTIINRFYQSIRS